MYAITEKQTHTPTNGGKVNFQFKHILSQVVFKAKTQLENMEVEINEIKIHNPWTKGTYTLPKTSSEKGTWELTAPTVGSKWGAFTVVTGKKITVTSNGADISVDAPMLFVPQELTAWDVKKTKAEADTEHQVYLEITCKIKQETEYVFGSAGTPTGTTAEEKGYKTLYVPFGAIWEPGKCYTYTLIFGGGYDAQGQAILQPINFDAEVGEWKNADAKEIGVNK